MNKVMDRFFRLFAVVVFVLLPALVQAGVVVVAHPAVKIDGLSEQDVRQLFMGRTSVLPDGTPVKLLDLAEDAPARAAFLSEVMGKTEQQMRSHWTRQIFTGKAQPPKIMATDSEVMRTVSSMPGHVGYVDSAEAVRANVKVLYKAE